jgi:hypothetical protein
VGLVELGHGGSWNCNPHRLALGTIGASLIVGGLPWPWIVQAAPSRRTRWLIGPAAAVAGLAAIFGAAILVAAIWPDTNYYCG